jgi:hypothetical protein
MMEQWNSGIMGSDLRLVEPTLSPSCKLYEQEAGSERIMQCWINGPATGGSDDKIKMANILLKNQYSIVLSEP